MPVPGTDLTIRAGTWGEYKDLLRDAVDEALADRAFTVRAIQRRLDPQVPLDEVGAWPDDRLLAAATFCIPTPAPATGLTVDEELTVYGSPQIEGGDIARVAARDSLTFTSFRAAVREDEQRRSERWKRTMDGISTLKVGLASGTAGRIDEIQDAMSQGIAISGIAATIANFDKARLAALGDTRVIGAGLERMVEDTKATDHLQQLAQALAESTSSYSDRVDLGPPAEVRLLQAMLEQNDRASKNQIAVLTDHSLLMKRQGDALADLAADVTAQAWPRRLVLATAVVAAVTGLLGLMYAAGFLSPWSSAALRPDQGAPTPALATASPAAP